VPHHTRVGPKGTSNEALEREMKGENEGVTWHEIITIMCRGNISYEHGIVVVYIYIS
jgi:hypothetical protein